MLQAEKISFTYPQSQTPALTDINISAKEGELIAIVGENGSGKSTLLKVLSGFAPNLIKGQREGTLKIGEVDPGSQNTETRIKCSGLLFSQPECQLSGICSTVEEEIAWGLGNLAIPKQEMRTKVDNVMRLLKLTELKDREPFSLSTGQMQRLALASLVALEPQVLFLDEPASFLDAQGRREVLNVADKLAKNGHIIFWATPNLGESSLIPRWIVLEKGKIIYDGKSKLLFDGTKGPLEAPWTRLARESATSKEDLDSLPITEEEAISQFLSKYKTV